MTSPTSGATGSGPTGAAPVGGGEHDEILRRVPAHLAERLRANATVAAGERKRVTVLFCDLVGSTAIADRLDAEEFRDLLDRYVGICLAEIYRFEGIVTHLAGDGVMALFGAPIAHEDAPQRAVRAALAIRDSLERSNAAEIARHGTELRARFGIHTGPVVLGAVGNDLRMEYTAIGDTTNIASRLEALARPGTIVISDATERLVRGRFELRPLDPVEVKGKPTPVQAFEVSRPLDVDFSIGAPKRGLTKFVGREEELAQIESCFDRLGGRLAQLVAIVGDAGSGKSRLVYEFLQRLDAERATVLETRCSSLNQIVPSAPWVALVRQHFGVTRGESPASAMEKVRRGLVGIDDRPDRLAPLFRWFFGGGTGAACEPGAAGTAEGDEREGAPTFLPRDEKEETFEAVGRLIAGLARQRPLVIVFEDLHWIDELSREMLELAVTRIRSAPVMILVTHRPDFEPRWRSGAAFTEIHLRPLTGEPATCLIRAAAGGELPLELEERIRDKADGNPLLLEEIARSLAEEGYLRNLDGRIELTRPVDEIRIPDTVQELIGARLDRLGPAGKRVAQVSSVLGRQFRRDLLERLLEGEGIDVAAQLSDLERRGVVHRKVALSAEEFRFGESVTQELAYESLLVRERRQLHERVAHLIEEGGDDMTPERSALLAHHFGRAEDRARAASALLRAASDAERVPSYDAALRLYQQAWEASQVALAGGEDDARRRMALDAALGLCRVVVLYGTSDDPADIAQIARRGRALARALGDTDALAAATSYQGLMEMGGTSEDFARGLELVEEALVIARSAGSKPVELSIARALSWAYFFDARFDLALETIDATIAEIRRMDPPDRPSDLQFGARYMRDSIRYHSGELETARRELEETHEMALQRGNRTIQSGTASTLSQLHYVRGEFAEASRWADRSLAISEEISNAGAIRPSAAVALASRIELGLPAPVARRLSQMEQGLNAAGLAPMYIRFVVDAMMGAGEPRRAERALEYSIRHSGGRLREMLNLTTRGNLLLRQGPRGWREAERVLDRAIELGRETGARLALAPALVAAAELALARGDVDSAAEHLEPAIELCAQLGLGRDLQHALRIGEGVRNQRSAAGAAG